ITVLLQQRRGSVLYDVRPGGPRRWTIECGLATVEVIGTAFRIDRTSLRVHVEVFRGVVLVRGERVPDRAARLTAGMSLDVTAAAPAATTAPWEPAPPPPALTPAASASAAEAPAHPAPTWRELARRGDSAQAYRELGPGGLARAAERAPVVDLL